MQESYSCREPSTTSRATFASAMAAKTCQNRSRNSALISTPNLDLEIVTDRQRKVLDRKTKRGTEKTSPSHRKRSPLRALLLTFKMLTSSFYLRRAHGPPLLEAFPAKNRAPLRGTEGNGGFLPALRAIGLGL